MLLAQEYVPDLSQYKDRFMRTPIGLLSQGNVSGAINRLGTDAQARVQAMSSPESALQTGMDFMGGGLLGVIKNPVTQQKALQTFGRTRDPQQAFYLLDDGSLLSGENVLNIPKDLKMFEHVEAPIRSDVMLNENVSEDYIGSLINKFIDDTGAARYYNRPDYGGIQLVNSNKPSDAQIRAMANQFKNKELAIDINDINTGDVYKDKVFQNPTYEEIKKFIDESYK